ncbi:hypothetical protein PROFUN_01312 [Planoprotostelium fungivorum]|uniref:Uncharacterized protein n=1 Tax=Planoprotostelium fungivorum TaxID=1890364 RepID=A0A2P6NZU9_9EUKA|nr:hypothetical protein PROFUN_01312 [Planoprotostelium fungivorum]
MSFSMLWALAENSVGVHSINRISILILTSSQMASTDLLPFMNPNTKVVSLPRMVGMDEPEVSHITYTDYRRSPQEEPIIVRIPSIVIKNVVNTQTFEMKESMLPLQRRAKAKSKCFNHNCLLCTFGVAHFLNRLDGDINWRKPGRREIAIAIMSLLEVTQRLEWYSLKTDIYPALEAHLHLFQMNLSERSPQRQIHDSMAHNKKYFISGKETVQRNGLWRLSKEYRTFLEKL